MKLSHGQMTLAWTIDRHGTHTVDLGSASLRLSVRWDSLRPRGSTSPPYVASVFGARLRMRFETVEEAKAQAEATARRMIEKAVAALVSTDGTAVVQ